MMAYVDHVESSVEIKRREQEERRQRRKRQIDHDNTNDPLMKIPRFVTRLPPGWLDCPNFGSKIGNLRLIPSKVPLDESFNDEIPPGKRYSSVQAIKQQVVRKDGQVVERRKLGLVIDLTNSSRYYKVSDWKDKGIRHSKIPCKGRDSVPENEAVNEFVYEVSQFLEKEKNQKEYILVHCTHGHNRTGFMIVHYLVRTLRISVTNAIKMFADARPPGIYKPDYIEALYRFYHEEKRPDKFVCPPVPEWKKGSEGAEEDDDVDGDAYFTDEDGNCDTEPVLTNDDLLGDKIPIRQEEVFRHLCYQLMKLPLPEEKRGQPRRLHFPGSHPVSLDKDNLQLLKKQYYYATWKADGTRYMMLITKDGCYLIDRHFNFRRVQMRFPCRPPHRYHHFTLLDGEMVLDKQPDTGKLKRRYLVYDMIAFNRVSLVDKKFHERWKMLEKEVIKPRDMEIHARKESLKDPEKQQTKQSPNPHYRYESEPFEVVRKHFWLLSTVEKILKRLIPQQLLHGADGVIFQGRDDRYVPLTHHGLLKWKFPDMNSVDFLFEMENKQQVLYLYEQGKEKRERNMVVFPDGFDPETCVGKIIECSWNSKGGVWNFMRMRPDKRSPNEFNTYVNVMKSINDNITEDVLLNEVKEIVKLPMYKESDRKQNESKAEANQKQNESKAEANLTS